MSRRISSPELIGRAAELSSLGAALDDARAGQGRVVVVEGDAGLGKTRLVEHFTSQAAGYGYWPAAVSRWPRMSRTRR